MQNKISKLIVIIGLTVLALNPVFVYAQNPPKTTTTTVVKEPAAQPVEELPVYNAGVDKSIQDYLCTPSDPADGHDLERCVNRLFRFSVTAGALIVVFMIIYAGYMYITGGEQSKTKAKGYLSSSLTGMALLLGSYALLYFVNPSLTQFKPIQPPIFDAAALPTCKDVGFGVDCLIEPGVHGVSTGNGGAVPTGDPGQLPPGGKCLNNACPAPSTFKPPLVDMKTTGADFKNNSFADPSVLDRMIALKKYLDANGGPKLRVTEAYPPSSNHSSTCHYNGRCFDISPAEKSVDAFNKYCRALKAVGINSFLNEASSQATECGASRQTTFGTGPHIHINTYR